jgi:hypothetical protein
MALIIRLDVDRDDQNLSDAVTIGQGVAVKPPGDSPCPIIDAAEVCSDSRSHRRFSAVFAFPKSSEKPFQRFPLFGHAANHRAKATV